MGGELPCAANAHFCWASDAAARDLNTEIGRFAANDPKWFFEPDVQLYEEEFNGCQILF